MTNLPKTEENCWMRDRCAAYFYAAIEEGGDPELYCCSGKDACEHYKPRVPSEVWSIFSGIDELASALKWRVLEEISGYPRTDFNYLKDRV